MSSPAGLRAVSGTEGPHQMLMADDQPTVGLRVSEAGRLRSVNPTPACVPVVGQVAAGNHTRVWSTDPVFGTVIIGDLGLQKHFSRKSLWLLIMTPSFLILIRKYLLIFGLFVADLEKLRQGPTSDRFLKTK